MQLTSDWEMQLTPPSALIRKLTLKVEMPTNGVLNRVSHDYSSVCYFLKTLASQRDFRFSGLPIRHVSFL